MELNFVEVYSRLNDRNWTMDKDVLLAQVIETFRMSELLTYNLVYHGGFNSNKKIANINPLLWEYGHTLHFWEHIVLKYLGYLNFTTKDELYDSFKINLDNRFKLKDKMLSYLQILNGYKKVIEFINNYTNDYGFTKVTMYLIRLGQLHLEMHNESFIFSNQVLGINVLNYEYIYKYETPLEDIEMINVKPGNLRQGVDFNTKEFYFDNESPSFIKFISNFQVSKYCITNYQYLKFVESDGYKKKKFWSEEGWSYIKNKKLNHPIYWKKMHNTWLEKLYDKEILLRNNNPVVYISWYEAMAYCNWKGVRLLKEEEWEYLANLDLRDEQISNAHLNYGFSYNTHSTISVLSDKSENRINVVGLFGNCWEWCLEPIYPYDGFVIDPVYREMSYPHFGYKRICRGGSWAVPNFLINSHYRNAQAPDCCHQIIGFRVAKSYLYI